MATRKKKTSMTESADIAEMEDKLLATDAKSVLRNEPSGGWPKMNQGTHLTVKTFEDGSTELIWDHDQLLKEVIEATKVK
jgi:hypothetical protein